MKEVTITEQIAYLDLTPEQITQLRKKIEALHDEDIISEDNFSQTLLDLFNKIKKHTLPKQITKQIMKEETVAEIHQNYDSKFIADILNLVAEHNYRFHATTIDSAKAIMQTGLKFTDAGMTGDLNNTSVMLSNLTDDEILFNLFNNMHKYQKQIIVLKPNAKATHLEGKHYIVSPDQIKGYIDIENQKVLDNPTFEFNQEERQLNLRQKTNSSGEKERQTPPTINQMLDSTIGYLNDNIKINGYKDIDNYNSEMYDNIVWLFDVISTGRLNYDQELLEKYQSLMQKYNTMVQDKLADIHNATI